MVKKLGYTVSELMDGNKNITETKTGQTVTIGRMKGNIVLGAKIYKMTSKELFSEAKESMHGEHKKIGLNASIAVKFGKPISIKVTSASDLELYKDLYVNVLSDFTPSDFAKSKPLTKDIVISQISKTTSTPYEFKKITVDLDDNIFLPKLSILNELRRTVLNEVERYAINKISRKSPNLDDFLFKSKDEKLLDDMRTYAKDKIQSPKKYAVKTSLLLNILHLDYDYTKLEKTDKLYIPLKYFTDRKYENILKTLSSNFDTYIYMPTIVKGNYKNLLYSNIENTTNKFDIKGFVISNICNIKLLNNLFDDLDKNYKLISNYTFNVFNKYTVLELKKLGVSTFTISPELDKETILDLCNYNYLQKELIVYGKTPVLNMNYCLLGESDKCYPECLARCTTNNKYYLKDRLNLKFRIVPDNIQTVTTIYNSKTTSISPKDFDVDFARIDVLDENILEINEIIKNVKEGKTFEGKDFTSGNLNRTI